MDRRSWDELHRSGGGKELESCGVHAPILRQHSGFAPPCKNNYSAGLKLQRSLKPKQLWPSTGRRLRTIRKGSTPTTGRNSLHASCDINHHYIKLSGKCQATNLLDLVLIKNCNNLIKLLYFNRIFINNY